MEPGVVLKLCVDTSEPELTMVTLFPIPSTEPKDTMPTVMSHRPSIVPVTDAPKFSTPTAPQLRTFITQRPIIVTTGKTPRREMVIRSPRSSRTRLPKTKIAPE